MLWCWGRAHAPFRRPFLFHRRVEPRGYVLTHLFSSATNLWSDSLVPDKRLNQMDEGVVTCYPTLGFSL